MQTETLGTLQFESQQKISSLLEKERVTGEEESESKQSPETEGKTKRYQSTCSVMLNISNKTTPSDCDGSFEDRAVESSETESQTHAKVGNMSQDSSLEELLVERERFLLEIEELKHSLEQQQLQSDRLQKLTIEETRSEFITKEIVYRAKIDQLIETAENGTQTKHLGTGKMQSLQKQLQEAQKRETLYCKEIEAMRKNFHQLRQSAQLLRGPVVNLRRKNYTQMSQKQLVETVQSLEGEQTLLRQSLADLNDQFTLFREAVEEIMACLKEEALDGSPGARGHHKHPHSSELQRKFSNLVESEAELQDKINFLRVSGLASSDRSDKESLTTLEYESLIMELRERVDSLQEKESRLKRRLYDKSGIGPNTQVRKLYDRIIDLEASESRLQRKVEFLQISEEDLHRRLAAAAGVLLTSLPPKPDVQREIFQIIVDVFKKNESAFRDRIGKLQQKNDALIIKNRSLEESESALKRKLEFTESEDKGDNTMLDKSEEVLGHKVRELEKTEKRLKKQVNGDTIQSKKTIRLNESNTPETVVEEAEWQKIESLNFDPFDDTVSDDSHWSAVEITSQPKSKVNRNEEIGMEISLYSEHSQNDSDSVTSDKPHPKKTLTLYKTENNSFSTPPLPNTLSPSLPKKMQTSSSVSESFESADEVSDLDECEDYKKTTKMHPRETTVDTRKRQPMVPKGNTLVDRLEFVEKQLTDGSDNRTELDSVAWRKKAEENGHLFSLSKKENKTLKDQINRLEQEVEEKTRYFEVLEKLLKSLENILSERGSKSDQEITQKLGEVVQRTKAQVRESRFHSDNSGVKDTAALVTDLNRKERDLVAKYNEVTSLKKQVQQWQDDFHSVEQMRVNALDCLRCLEVEVLNLEGSHKKLISLQENYQKSQKTLGDLEQRCSLLDNAVKEKEICEQEITLLKARLEECGKVEAELALFKGQSEAYEKALTDMMESEKSQKEENSVLKRRISDLELDLAVKLKTCSEIEQIRSRNQELGRDNGRLSEEVTDLREKLSHLQGQSEKKAAEIQRVSAELERLKVQSDRLPLEKLSTNGVNNSQSSLDISFQRVPPHLDQSPEHILQLHNDLQQSASSIHAGRRQLPRVNGGTPHPHRKNHARPSQTLPRLHKPVALHHTSLSLPRRRNQVFEGPPSPPSRFLVERPVGGHGVMLSWQPPELDEFARSNGSVVGGYTIYLNGRVCKEVSSPHMSKTVIENVELRDNLKFLIQSVAVNGQASSLVEAVTPAEFSQSMESSYESEADLSGVLSEVQYDQGHQRAFLAVYDYSPIEHSPHDYTGSELSFQSGDGITV